MANRIACRAADIQDDVDEFAIAAFRADVARPNRRLHTTQGGVVNTSTEERL